MPSFGDYKRVLHKVGSDSADYVVCYQDISSDPYYYCYVDQDGRWLILRQDTAGGTFKYAKGKSGVDASWAIRASLTYVIWSELF